MISTIAVDTVPLAVGQQMDRDASAASVEMVTKALETSKQISAAAPLLVVASATGRLASRATQSRQMSHNGPSSVGSGSKSNSFAISFPSFAASDTIFGLPDIPSEFDPMQALQRAWGSGAIPISAKPDNVGAFRFICGPGQVLADDPIMYPGQPGKSHLHQFYGNLEANAYSTYESLRKTGRSSCNVGPAAVNRSGYWMPALLDGNGNVVRPDYVSIYYKRQPLSDPVVSDPKNPRFMGYALPLPNGLRFIFGRDMTNLAARPTGNFHFLCQTRGGAPVTKGSVRTMAEALSVCKPGNQFAAIVDAPHCWDGKNLDSPNHRDHVAYPSYRYSWKGALKCPPSHPFVIPTFTLGARWTIHAADDTKKWCFSSDVAMQQPCGSTFHADWFGAWDNKVLLAWTLHDIDRLLNASGGDLGNGLQLKGASSGSFVTEPRLIPLAEVPKTKVR